MKNCQNAKNCQKLAIFLKIAKNPGRDFPEGTGSNWSISLCNGLKAA